MNPFRPVAARLRGLLCFFATASVALASAGAEWFAAPGGAAPGDGSRERPFTSLEAARDAARESLRAGKAPVTVSLFGGLYRLDSTLVFDARDSGRDGAPTIYRAVPGEKPVLSGGDAVKGWRAVDAARGLYEAPVGSALFRQVYLNGELLTRARHPNGGWLGPFWRLAGADVKGRRIFLKREDWTEARALAGDETIEVAWNGHWTHYRGKVGAVEQRDGRVALGIDSPDEAAFFRKSVSYFTDSPFFFEGAAGFLDEIGEWHHDPANGLLRVRFAAGVNPETARIEVPRLPILVDVAGKPKEPVRNLEFRGITFESSNWIRPSVRSFPSTQFAQPYAGEKSLADLAYPTGMIRARHAAKLAIRDCGIRNAGATGIQFWSDVSDSDIEGNEIGPVMANGIELEVTSGTRRFIDDEGPGKGAPPAARGVNVAIWNNRIRECGRQYVNGGAILAHVVRGLIVDHNDISDLPYSAIQIGTQPGGYRDTGCRENLVRGNRIARVMRLLDDGGAIYTLGGQQRGTFIEENHVLDLERSPWAGDYWISGIYLDNFTQFVTARRNVIVNTPSFYGEMNQAKDNVFTENEGMIVPEQKTGAARSHQRRLVGFRAMQEVEAVIRAAGPRSGHDPRAPWISAKASAPTKDEN